MQGELPEAQVKLHLSLGSLHNSDVWSPVLRNLVAKDSPKPGTATICLGLTMHTFRSLTQEDRIRLRKPQYEPSRTS